MTEEYNKRYPGWEIESLRHKNTRTHRRKHPTGDPNFSPEDKDTKRAKESVYDKTELDDCASIFEIENISEEDGSEVEGTETQYIESNSGLKVRARKAKKPDLMGVMVIQMHIEAPACDEA